MTESLRLSISPIDASYPHHGGISIELFRQFCDRFPQFVSGHGTYLEAPATLDNQESIKELLLRLQVSGIDVMDKKVVGAAFSMWRDKKYSHEELWHADYLMPHDIKVLGESTDEYLLDEFGVPHVKASVKPYKATIGALLNEPGPVILVRRPVKERLERSHLKGLKFVEPTLKGRRQVEGDERVWAVWSDAVLPPMKNILYDYAGERFRWNHRKEFPRGCMYTEGYAFRPEPHYLRKEVGHLGDFDIALTLERFGSGSRSLQPEVVISHKLAEILFDELGMGFSGRPVHLDDDNTIPWVGPFPPPWEHLNRRPDWMAAFENP